MTPQDEKRDTSRFEREERSGPENEQSEDYRLAPSTDPQQEQNRQLDDGTENSS